MSYNLTGLHVNRSARDAMDALPPPPPGIDLTDDRRLDIVATSVITWLVAIVITGLRIMSRRVKGIHLWLDDWLIISSLPFTTFHVFGMAGYSVSRGLGRHIWVGPRDAMRGWAIGLFIAELGYFFTFICVKCSILAFYWRSFSVRRSIKIPIWSLAITVLLWGMAVILVTLLQCQPTYAWWARFDPDNPLPKTEYACNINPTKFFYGNAIPTIVTDILMLILPVPYIWNLKLPRQQKMAVIGVFVVGIFVTVVSIVRLNFLLRADLTDPDITWNFVDIGLWSIIEANTAIICASLPFLRPIISKISFGAFNIRSSSSKQQTQPSSSYFRTKDQQSDSINSKRGPRHLGDESDCVYASDSCPENDEHPFAYSCPYDASTSIGSAHAYKAHPLDNIELRTFELKTSHSTGKPIESHRGEIIVTKEVHIGSHTA